MSFLLLIPGLMGAKKQGDPTSNASHLLHRATFGPKPGEVEKLARLGEKGISDWIEKQLHPQNIPDTATEQKLQKLPSLAMSNDQIAISYPKPNKKNPEKMKEMDGEPPRQLLIELETQKLIRATESDKEFQEVLVDFWFNHFNVDFSKGREKWFITTYERDAIRKHVFGSFYDLLKATAQNPAMLFYLDNFQSVKNGFQTQTKNAKKAAKAPKGLNENYARELMELHTLGVDAGYTQKDVIEVARILTGWSLDRAGKGGGTYKFIKEAHDMGAKKVMGMNFPAGGGEEEGIRLLKFLSQHPATANRIAKKLAVRFISDNPPQSAIDALAKTFLDTNGDLTAVYRKIFQLPEFWSEDAKRAKIKKPFHFIASAIRALDGKVRPDSARGLKKLDQSLTQMGEPVYRCQPPTGFKDTAEFWVNPGALVTRINVSLEIADQRSPAISFNMDQFRNKFRSMNVDDDKTALRYLNDWILGGNLQPATLDRIAQELVNDGPKVLEEPEAKKADQPAKTINLPQMVGLLLGSPDFQRY